MVLRQVFWLECRTSDQEPQLQAFTLVFIHSSINKMQISEWKISHYFAPIQRDLMTALQRDDYMRASMKRWRNKRIALHCRFDQHK